MSRAFGLDYSELSATSRAIIYRRACIVPPVRAAERFMEHMYGPIKVLDDKLRLVLLRSLGNAVVTSDFPNFNYAERRLYAAS
jgi:3-dehydroquinate synthase